MSPPRSTSILVLLMCLLSLFHLASAVKSTSFAEASIGEYDTIPSKATATRTHRQGRPSPYASHPPLLLAEYESLLAEREEGEAEQVHIMTSGDPNNLYMVVSWLTWTNVSQPTVKYGSSSGQYTYSSPAVTTTWIDPASEHRVRIQQDATVQQGIQWASTYYYVVGDAATEMWSEEYYFRTLPKGGEGDVVRMVVLGDFGLVNSQSRQMLINEVQQGTLDLIVHVGDFAYDLHTNNGTVGDAWLDSMEPIFSSIPYQVCAGNHEGKWNFTHYMNRFSGHNYIGAPETGKTGHNLYFSTDYMSGGALVHIAAINTEFYYVYVDENQPPDYTQQRQWQYDWLDADLKAAKARGADWLIVYGHRPMYCSNVDDMPDCSTDPETLRVGWNNTLPGLEPILMQYGVDMFLAGHEHSYERLFPVYNGTTEFPSNNAMYLNPKYPTHIITGSAGCQEYFDSFDTVFYGPWSAYRSMTYGYAHMQIFNRTHLYFEQLIDEGKQQSDEFWIVKNHSDKPKPATPTPKPKPEVTAPSTNNLNLEHSQPIGDTIALM